MRQIVLFLSLTPLLFGQRLTIASGLVDDQVLQRNSSNKAEVQLAGTAVSIPNNRPVEVRVTGKYGPLAGLDWSQVGKIERGKWVFKLTMPTGGPYRVEIRSATAVEAIQNVFVGDLWVLAGQSNMEGVGDLIDVQPPHGLVHTFDQLDQWGVAEEPLHLLPGAVDRVHWRLNEKKEPERYQGEKLTQYLANRKKGAGLGLPFAAEMVRRTGVPIGLVPCAHGGTSMDQWSPEMRDKAGDSLYGATVRRIRAVGGTVRGVLWYQGESDANPKVVAAFPEKFEKLVAAFRADTGQQDLPFYFVQIGRHTSLANVNEWNMIQEMQRKAEARIRNSGMAPAVDLSLDDQIHVGTQDLKRLGTRLANLACHDLFPEIEQCRQMARGPRPAGAVFSNGVLRVTFAEVNGRLRSQGRIAGFTVHDKAGAAIPAYYKAEFDAKDGGAILLHVTGKLPEGATLRYGYGKDPYCNLRDSADMAVPVFGPLAIELK